MSHKVFEIEPTTREAPSFEIKGTRRERKPAEGDNEPEWVEVEFSETFRCLPVLPPGFMKDYALTALRLGGWPVASLIVYIMGCLEEDEEQRFDALTHDKAVRIESSLLSAISDYLSEEYNARPTKPSTRSRAGRSQRKGSSQGASGSKASKKKS